MEMSGVFIADGICPTENCPSDKYRILYWLNLETINLTCAVCETSFLYMLGAAIMDED